MRRSIIIIIAITASWSAAAQNEADVQRLSSNYLFGTARNSALGGAMGALGGDMSAVFYNPAAIGVFRFSEISATPGLEMNTINSNLSGETGTGNVSKVVLNNAGFVLSNETKNPNWRSFNLGISYNRINSFNDVLNIGSDVSYFQSLVYDFVNEANGLTVDQLNPLSADLAYRTFVIDGPDPPGNFFGAYIPGDIIEQKQEATRSGRLSETSLAFGGNYDDIIYLGGSLNIQSVRYESQVVTTERYLSSTNPPLPGDPFMTSYALTEELKIDGIALNLRIGAIAKIGEVIRLGGSIQTPTTFSLTDDFTNSITANWINDSQSQRFAEAVGFDTYRIRTPWRYMASLATFIGKKGFISGQYEYANFAGGELKEASGNSGSRYNDVNLLIASQFTGVHTFRVGMEFRATKSLFLRGGFARFSNPIPSNEEFAGNANLNRLQYSGGIGYRKALWSLDASYVMSRFDELYKATANGYIATLENSLGLVSLTFSYRL
jgi:long-subunit fatty acid transport protein